MQEMGLHEDTMEVEMCKACLRTKEKATAKSSSSREQVGRP